MHGFYKTNFLPVVNITINGCTFPCIFDTGFSGQLLLNKKDFDNAELQRIDNTEIVLADNTI